MSPTSTTADQQAVPDDQTYPSRNIAFRAAHAITSIVDNLVEHDQLKYCPAFIVYCLFSALIMHVYQMRSPNPNTVTETRERMRRCMDALKAVSRVWVVAKMVYTLFESVLGNKALEERLQKASSKRHHTKRNGPQPSTEPIKRKFDDMEIGAGIGTTGQPSHNMSYERSRPQTPAATPAALPTGEMLMPGVTAANPFAGPQSRGATRPPTPFNIPAGNIPTTPPDLYLVTRSSPPIPASLWETFQPDQLFPDDSGLSYLSPQAQMMDPTAAAGMQHQQGYGIAMGDAGMMSPQMQQQQAKQWLGAAFDPSLNGGDVHMQGSSPGDDTWSNSSKGGIVPTTLNVEDWCVVYFSPHQTKFGSWLTGTGLISLV